DRTSFRYADHYASLAEYGQDRGIKIGIEHFPGTAFPSVKKTLDFIREVDHPNLYLLFDIGHAQISEEDPVEAIELAGDRLVYVHLDDNDGKDDLHLPLTEGVQSEESLKRFFLGLRNCGYSGHVSLEMHPKLPNPFNAIKQSKAVVENCW
ncbi:MAG: sugar phosphate isomerase/epimerase, partial [Verrucomicrobiae bacterium]|nr:sugar phosphate isomerase/epimerase [Verrucomicrobiae bacterium]